MLLGGAFAALAVTAVHSALAPHRHISGWFGAPLLALGIVVTAVCGLITYESKHSRLLYPVYIGIIAVSLTTTMLMSVQDMQDHDTQQKIDKLQERVNHLEKRTNKMRGVQDRLQSETNITMQGMTWTGSKWVDSVRYYYNTEPLEVN